MSGRPDQVWGSEEVEAWAEGLMRDGSEADCGDEGALENRIDEDHAACAHDERLKDEGAEAVALFVNELFQR